ncbi:hypothetical protein C9374_014660 [Naegleria lovaniensis]|uniref:Uncharacterized protein n=1 Tax=Naegleria lovaniensis TaxID=51637 RepID=A0AA88KMS3_NAELO|nr:uncharacterized protein C9374_014660 [Naegleria lovaniensis]KAG2389260.1 hypothetical protein C9374_014660 [Naegleria lovaniensis]
MHATQNLFLAMSMLVLVAMMSGVHPFPLQQQPQQGSVQLQTQVAPTSFTNVPEAKYCVRYLNQTQNDTQQGVTFESYYDCGKSGQGADLNQILQRNPDRMDLLLYHFSSNPKPTYGMMGYSLLGSPTPSGQQSLPNSISTQLPSPNFQMWISLDRIVEFSLNLQGGTDLNSESSSLHILQDFPINSQNIPFTIQKQQYGGQGRRYKSILADLEIPLNAQNLGNSTRAPYLQKLHVRAILSESETRARTDLLSGGGAQGGRDAFAFRTTPTSITLQVTAHGLRSGAIQGTGNIGESEIAETESTWAVFASVFVGNGYVLNTKPQKRATAPWTTTGGHSYPLPYDVLPDYYLYNVSSNGKFTLGSAETGAPQSPLGYFTLPRFAYGNEKSRIQLVDLVNRVQQASSFSSSPQTDAMKNSGSLSSEVTRVVMIPAQKQEASNIGENRNAVAIQTVQFAPIFIGAVEVTNDCNCANNVQTHWQATGDQRQQANE